MIAEISATHRTTEMFLQIAQRLTGRGETKKPQGFVAFAFDREVAGQEVGACVEYHRVR